MIVDASAAVEYLLQSSLGLRVMALMADAEVAAPEILDVEVLAILRREVMRGCLDAKRAGEALDDLLGWGLERIPHGRLLRGAWQLRGHVTACDALCVEATRQRGVALITADGPLARAPGLGIAVHNVRISR